MVDLKNAVLHSLRLYDALRRNASDVIRSEGSNIDRFAVDGQDIALCHLSAILPFTTGGKVPQEAVFEESASASLAIHHLNTGDGSIAPQVEGLNERCKMRFTIEFADTEFQGGVALNHVVTQTNREPGSAERIPCAFLGAWKSSISIPMSIVTGLLGYPQVSAASTSADLDDTSQYPLFGRTVPSDAGNAIPIVIYLREVLNIQHLAVLNVNDAYGNAYVEGMRKAAEVHAPDMVIHQIPVDDGQSSIASAVQSLKKSEFRFVFALVFSVETHDALLTEAYKHGVAGNGHHNWLFADSFVGTLDGRSFEKGSPLHLSYRGVGMLEVSGGVAGQTSFDKYSTKMEELKNPTDLEYLSSLFPSYDDPNYGEGTPYVQNEDFLAPLKSAFSPFIYDATIALGLAACSAYEENLSFSGQEHFDHFVRTTFKGASGAVALDQSTGTRDPQSTIYRVANFVEVEDGDSISYKQVVTDLFQEGKWNQQAAYMFNDGTNDLPSDLPPPVEADKVNVGATVGGTVVIAFILGVVVFLFYENKRKRNDSVWKVERSEVKFADPPEVIGRGTFGTVLLAEYRGTQVAVKRVLPHRGKGRKLDTMHSGLETANSSDISGNAGMMSMGMKSGAAGISSWGGMGSLVGGFKSGIGRSGVAGRQKQSDWKKLKSEFLEEMRYLSKLRHPCITTTMGAVMGKDPMMLMEYMEHGSLYDLLHNETMALDGELLLPMLRDISSGLRFLHSAGHCHGDLKAANILIDGKFRAKVADFGLSQKKNRGGTGTPFWMAPELLRAESSNTPATDVYSFGIILYEVYSRRDPYEGEEADEVLRLVADIKVRKRPPVPRNMPDNVKTLMTDCVEEESDKRPTFEEVDVRLKRIDSETADPGHSPNKSASVSLFDIFPRHIAEALRDGRTVEPEHRDSVTIFFSDIVSFTTISSTMEPRKIANMLDRLYSKFDALSHKHDVFKVETIGDAYMAVTNLVKDQIDDHAKRIASFAIEAIKAANETYIDDDDHSRGTVNIRVGFHSGSVVADVVGTRNPRYCLFGDTVNTSSRMESNSEKNRIHCSKAAARLLKEQCPDLPLKPRGRIPIKGKGMMRTFWVNEQGISRSMSGLGLDDNASSDFILLDVSAEQTPESVVPEQAPAREAAPEQPRKLEPLMECVSGELESSEMLSPPAEESCPTKAAVKAAQPETVRAEVAQPETVPEYKPAVPDHIKERLAAYLSHNVAGQKDYFL